MALISVHTTLQTMLFRLIIPILILALQAYLLRRFWKWSANHAGVFKRMRWPVLVTFVVFNVALLLIAIFRVRDVTFPEWFIYSAVYPFYWWHSATFVLGFALLIVALFKLPFRGIWAGLKRLPATRDGLSTFRSRPSLQRFDQSRRVFLRRSVYGLTAASFGATAYGMIVEKHGCEINQETLLVPGLPLEFSGYSIGLVTDIHSSMYMLKRDMDEYVRMLNAMGVDLVVVGGDIVNGAGDEVLPFADAFSGLRTRDGVYGVLGNHDFYSREPDRIAEVSAQAGVQILRDEGRIIRRGKSSIRLLGIDDVGNAPAAGRRMDTALASIPTEGPSILMNHRPYFLDEAATRNIDVMLSGHTHGGQVVFGKFADTILTPAALASPFVWGLYRQGKTQMYVSRGVGTVGIPVRINCPPELTRIELRPA